MNWHVSGASELSETGAARSSSSSPSARMAAAAAELLRRSRPNATSLVTASYSWGAREAGERPGPLLEAAGKGFGTVAHYSPPADG